MNNIENQTQSFQNNENFTGGSLKNSAKNSLKGSINYSALNNETMDEKNSYLSTNSSSFKAELEGFIAQSVPYDNNIKDILEDMDICEVLNLDTMNIDKIDAMFFINAINQSGITNYMVSDNGNIVNTLDYKNIEISKTLSNLLVKANETKKAIRLDFDNNVTLILKLNQDGKINAHFIPGNKAVEEYLKNNIPYLKQRFDEQNIPYANISYKNHKQRGSGQQNNKEKK